jgi:ankyrin repeat protein
MLQGGRPPLHLQRIMAPVTVLAVVKGNTWLMLQGGWTPLHLATHGTHLEVVAALLGAGVDANPTTTRVSSLLPSLVSTGSYGGCA